MPSSRPNILLLLTDQQRFDTIQALGSHFNAQTPHLDSLVRAGTSFENAFCTAPVCSPSRSTLMTGLHPVQAGIPANLSATCPPLSTSLSTVGKSMRSAGYQTVYHGKWHLGGNIHDHGFEISEECSHDETTRLLASRFWKDRDWEINDRPFFHTVSFLNPHDHYFYDPERKVSGFKRPWNNTSHRDGMPPSVAARQADWPEERWGAYFEFYEQLIERVDADIGETLHQLKCSGFYKNTWIIFASDHGDMAGEHDLPFKGPFMYDGVCRVPLIIVPPQPQFSGPAGLKEDFVRPVPGKRAQLCSLLDVVPTILDLGGATCPTELPGRSLAPLLFEPLAEAPHEYVFASWCRPEVRMARSAEWKYIVHGDGEEELYHLTNDPHEMNNLANSEDSRTAKQSIIVALQCHLDAIDDPFPKCGSKT